MAATGPRRRRGPHESIDLFGRPGPRTMHTPVHDDGWRLGARPGLDQVRGVAVLLVLLSHGLVGTQADKAGAIGVTLFFVLSGFLITRLLMEERWRAGTVDLRRFYQRRARRLLPPLLVALVLCAGANALVGGYPVRDPVAAALTYTVNFASTAQPFGAFTHLWSLAVEAHFYLLWPAVVGFAPRRVVGWVAGVTAVASATARIGLAGAEAEAYQWTFYRLDAILLGALLAVVVARAPRPGRRLVVASVAILAALSPGWAFPSFVTWGSTVVAVASVVVVASALTATKRRPRLEHLGRISYGVYLYHFPLTWIFDQLRAPSLVTFTATVVGGLALAELSWRAIERRVLGRRPRGAEQATPGTRPAVPTPERDVAPAGLP